MQNEEIKNKEVLEEIGIDLDILYRVENISNELNEMMAARTKPFFKRYPVTFMLLILLGAVALAN